MGVFDFLFGGTDTSSLDAQVAANQQAQELIRQQANLARADVLGIFPAAQTVQQQGFQAAANLFGESVPEQARLFGLGNVEAQRALTQGLAGQREAILGLPQDFSQQFLQQGIQQFEPSFGFQRRDIPIPEPILSSSLGLGGAGVPQIPQFFTGTQQPGQEGVEPSTLSPQQRQQGLTEIGPLITGLLGQENLPLLDRANTVFDEADRLGLSVQELAENSTLTVEEVISGLQQTGRTLPGLAPTTAPQAIPTFQGTQQISGGAEGFEIGNLVESLLSDTSIPINQRAITVFDEAARLGLTAQQLADSTPSLSLQDVLAGLQATGRTL